MPKPRVRRWSLVPLPLTNTPDVLGEYHYHPRYNTLVNQLKAVFHVATFHPGVKTVDNPQFGAGSCPRQNVVPLEPSLESATFESKISSV